MNQSATLVAAAALQPRPIYVFCLEKGVPGKTPQPISAQAPLIAAAGYTGAGYGREILDDVDGALRTLGNANLRLFLLNLTVDLSKTEAPFDPRLISALNQLSPSSTVISLMFTGLPPGDARGKPLAVMILRRLGDLIADRRFKVAVYPHTGYWAESTEATIDLVREVNHPSIGYCFTVCHWLKVEGDKDYRPLLRKNAAKLFVVMINGAQRGSTTWTNGLIQPLDRGNFDNRELLATLDAIGYQGPVALMCYGIPDDSRAQLERSMQTWRAWHAAATD